MMNELMHAQEPVRQAEWKQLAATREQARNALLPPTVPVIQITGAAGRELSPLVDDKVRFFEEWLGQHIPHAKHVLALHSAHAVPITDQELVIREVQKLVDQSSPGRPTPP